MSQPDHQDGGGAPEESDVQPSMEMPGTEGSDTDNAGESQSQVPASQSLPASIDTNSSAAPSPGASQVAQDEDAVVGHSSTASVASNSDSRPRGSASPGFRIRDSPVNSPGRIGSGMYSAPRHRNMSDATPQSSNSAYATPGPGGSSSGFGSRSSARTPLSQRGLTHRIPRGDLGQSSASRSASRRRSHGNLPPISPGPGVGTSGLGGMATSGLGMVGPTPPSTPGSAIRTGMRGAPPMSAISQLSASEHAGSSVASQSQHLASSQMGNSEINNAVIWGTTINVNDTMTAFRRFLHEFEGSQSQEDVPEMSEPYYMRVLAEIKVSQVYNINIDCKNLYNFHPTRRLYKQLLQYPQEIIPIMDLVVHQQFTQLYGESELQHNRIQVRTFNLMESRTMRDLDPSDIDQLVSVRGMIIRTSQVIPDLKQAFFQCMMCRSTTEVMIDRGRIQEPNTCTNCSARMCMQMVHNRCWFTDKQLVKLQEAPEAIPEGETPTTMSLYAFDDLVDVGKPGDRVEVTGIYRAVPARPNPKKRNVMSVYRTYVDVIHFRKTKKGQLTAENSHANPSSEYHTTFEEGDEVQEVSDARRRRLEEWSKDPDIYSKLSHALAPSVWQMEDIKKGILLMLFGGTNKVLPNKKLRGEINVLLCGDPGTSKSQLLGYVHKIAPRGMYTSGKGSSAVGLTAYISKDPETKEMTLESGALVLSDRGVCCIDEFDKMSDTTRAILHEAMEQQTVSIAKAGIIATLNARTSVLASANPVESRYNPNMSVVENIKLSPTLLSRFDLIYLVLDKPNAETDRRLARHLVNLYYETPTTKEPELKGKELAEYISYAREHVHPQITDEAAAALVEGYVDMRRLGINHQTAKKVITSTPRQLESLIRLSEAHARLHFSNQVTRQNVEEAIRLMNVATHKAATDPRTGAIDMDMITTGRTALGRQEQVHLAKELQKILYSYRGSQLAFYEIQKAMEDQSDRPIEEDDLTEALQMLADDNVVTFIQTSKKYRISSDAFNSTA